MHIKRDMGTIYAAAFDDLPGNIKITEPVFNKNIHR